MAGHAPPQLGQERNLNIVSSGQRQIRMFFRGEKHENEEEQKKVAVESESDVARRINLCAAIPSCGNQLAA